MENADLWLYTSLSSEYADAFKEHWCGPSVIQPGYKGIIAIYRSKPNQPGQTVCVYFKSLGIFTLVVDEKFIHATQPKPNIIHHGGYVMELTEPAVKVADVATMIVNGTMTVNKLKRS